LAIAALILTLLTPSLEAEIRCLKTVKPTTQKKKNAALKDEMAN
jgi:hypothetical protein